MSRPIKEGFDYFPFDVSLDKKIQAVESVFKNDGFVWIVKFWQQAYQSNTGYVCLDNYHGVIQAENARITTEKQKEIINMCLEIGLIYKTEDGYYTSTGIQKRIRFLISEREKWRKKNKIEITPEITPEIRGESKEKEIKEKNNKTNECLYIYSLYPKKVDRGHALKAIASALKKASFEILESAVKKYAQSVVDKDKQYVPNPATWFNGERWLDEEKTEKQNKQEVLFPHY